MNLDFSGSTVLVIGDVILDKYYYGKVTRISPEAPVPVVKVIRETFTPGGSGNVVNNINGLGAKSFHISLTGKDENAGTLKEILGKLNIDNKLIATDKPTVTKIRVIGEHQQVVRLDFEEKYEIDKSISNKIITAIDIAIDKAGAIVISDYGKGICTPEICEYIIHNASIKGIPVIVDPKGHDWTKYKNATMITPNVKELGEAAGREIPNEDHEIEKYGSQIINEYSLNNLLVTRSDKGMTLITKEIAHHIPTTAQEVYDVSGAGDTVIATLAVGLAGKLSVIDSADLANRAAGIVVGKFGTAPIELDELIHSFHTDYSKILPVKTLSIVVNQLIKKEKKIIFTLFKFKNVDMNSIDSIKAARKNGDVLIVGISNKKFANIDEISGIVSSLECVDYVVELDGENLPDIIKKNKNTIKIV